MTNEEIIDFLLKKIEEEEKWIASGEISEKQRFYDYDVITEYNKCINFLKDENTVVENFEYYEYGGVLFYDIVETYQFTQRTNTRSMTCWFCPCLDISRPPKASCNLIRYDKPFELTYNKRYNGCPLIKINPSLTNS